MDCETIEQRRRRAFIGLIAFIERHDPDAMRLPRRIALPCRLDPVSIKRGGEARCGRAALPFGHCENQHAAMRLRDQPRFGDRSAGAQRGGEIESAEQTIVGNIGRRPAHRRPGGQIGAQQIEPRVARRPGRGAKRHAGQKGIDCEKRRRDARPRPGVLALRGRCAGHAPRVSSIARATRIAEPASSSGLRRRR